MSASMTALQKPDGGVRRIATGISFRRLVARTLARQFGRAGTDCVGHAIRGVTDAKNMCTVLSIDGIGACDHVYRSATLVKLPSLLGLWRCVIAKTSLLRNNPQKRRDQRRTATTVVYAMCSPRMMGTMVNPHFSRKRTELTGVNATLQWVVRNCWRPRITTGRPPTPRRKRLHGRKILNSFLPRRGERGTGLTQRRETLSHSDEAWKNTRPSGHVNTTMWLHLHAHHSTLAPSKCVVASHMLSFAVAGNGSNNVARALVEKLKKTEERTKNKRSAKKEALKGSSPRRLEKTILRT